MLSVWFLSQSYTDETGWRHLVAYDYGQHYFAPVSPETDEQWVLVRVALDNHQIDAAKQDPRVVYCGKEYSPVPSQVLTVYASLLDPNVTYSVMGQVIDKLSETDMNFLNQ